MVSDFSIRTEPRPECYLCGTVGDLLYAGMRDRLYDVPGEWSLRRCGAVACGLVWLDPCPINEDIGKLYRTYYTHASSQSRVIRAYRWLSRAILSANLGYAPTGVFNRYLGKLLSQVGILRDAFEGSSLWQPAGKGKLLDIGCGSGSFLGWMRELGWEVYGVEPDPAGAEVTRQQGIPVRVGTLEEAAFSADEFDLITLSHVLEHLPDPIRTLAECRRILRPGGSVVAVTPNSGSRGARVHGRNWMPWDSPRHLMIFNTQTITEVARRAGFWDTSTPTSARTAWGINRVCHRLRHHSTVPGGRCPFQPWLLPRDLFYHISEYHDAKQQPVGEELVLLANKTV